MLHKNISRQLYLYIIFDHPPVHTSVTNAAGIVDVLSPDNLAALSFSQLTRNMEHGFSGNTSDVGQK